uniref:VWF/SSPO/Zonadhesin-like cysteine-rich domain-containing protein n=1 Tax=Panagrolaimus davidi TaxID=227884 RepID=A0A914QJG0_9BILA
MQICTKDVCECSHNGTTTTTTEKPCYCHAIEAFATQCANRFIWGQWTQILSQVRQFPVHPKCDKIRRPA